MLLKLKKILLLFITRRRNAFAERTSNSRSQSYRNKVIVVHMDMTYTSVIHIWFVVLFCGLKSELIELKTGYRMIINVQQHTHLNTYPENNVIDDNWTSDWFSFSAWMMMWCDYIQFNAFYCFFSPFFPL